ncbi:MAG TPA: ribosome assembly RNA-binding protein YhbY [Aeromonadales bacterium]|nr:ribosome assembly RNA-binding protein YhbY [Aeromonadales bacterium]
MSSLSNSQKRFLKSKAHALKPVVIIAGNGLSDNVLAAIEEALDIHELIKVKIKADDREEKNAITDRICQQTKAENIQSVGHVLTLFRPAKTAKIILPKK